MNDHKPNGYQVEYVDAAKAIQIDQTNECGDSNTIVLTPQEAKSLALWLMETLLP